MQLPDINTVVLWIFAGSSFLLFVLKMMLAVMKDSIREWRDFRAWYRKPPD